MSKKPGRVAIGNHGCDGNEADLFLEPEYISITIKGREFVWDHPSRRDLIQLEMALSHYLMATGIRRFEESWED
jgi:hypothetical protein